MALPKSAKRKVFDQRYEIISIVGRGAESVVYQARHLSGTGQAVALKVLVKKNDSTNLPDRLRKEALTLVSCRTKYVVRLDDFHSVDDICYLSMEYAPKGDLVRYAKELGGRVPVNQAMIFLKQCLEALDFIHATGVLHRDIKPENILVVSESEIRMADFGLALLPGDDSHIEELKQGVGTLAYLPPETIDGLAFDARSDLYALGVSFIEILIGENPFAGLPLAEQLNAQRDSQSLEKAISSASISPHLAAVLNKLVAFNSAERFSSAAEALKALEDENFQFSVSSSSQTISEPQAPQTAPRKDSILNDRPPVANSDQPEKPTPQSTEHIDLDRIKSIIASNAPQKTVATKQGTPIISTHEAEVEADKLASDSEAISADKSRHTKFNSAPPVGLTSFIMIAGGFALLTVAILLGATFIKSRLNNDSTGAITTQKTTSVKTDMTIKRDGVSLKRLPKGIHAGVVKGLFSPKGTPLAIISNPDKGSLALIVGVPGWIPAEINTGKATNNEYIFRSNGLILKLNQEMPSASITGTITDIVTGETGSWILNKP